MVLTLIQQWTEALKKAEKGNKSRHSAGHHSMTPEDSETVLEFGLPVAPRYDDLLRQVRHCVEEPESPALCVGVEGYNAAWEAYEISVKRG